MDSENGKGKDGDPPIRLRKTNEGRSVSRSGILKRGVMESTPCPKQAVVEVAVDAATDSDDINEPAIVNQLIPHTTTDEVGSMDTENAAIGMVSNSSDQALIVENKNGSWNNSSPKTFPKRLSLLRLVRKQGKVKKVVGKKSNRLRIENNTYKSSRDEDKSPSLSVSKMQQRDSAESLDTELCAWPKRASKSTENRTGLRRARRKEHFHSRFTLSIDAATYLSSTQILSIFDTRTLRLPGRGHVAQFEESVHMVLSEMPRIQVDCIKVYPLLQLRAVTDHNKTSIKEAFQGDCAQKYMWFRSIEDFILAVSSENAGIHVPDEDLEQHSV